MPILGAEKINFNFQRKGYQFSVSINKNQGQLHWIKSGFEVTKEYNLKTCWKKTIEKDLYNLRDTLSVKSPKKVFGEKTLIVWNGRKIEKSLQPKEMDQLDKRFTHLFSLLKTGEGKCIK
jgi:hypothetical protein